MKPTKFELAVFHGLVGSQAYQGVIESGAYRHYIPSALHKFLIRFELSRFIIGTIPGFIASSFVVFVLYGIFGISYIFAVIVGFVPETRISFFIKKFWVFVEESKDDNPAKRFAGYVVGAIVYTVSIFYAVERLDESVFWAIITTRPVLFVFSFLYSRFVMTK